MSACTRGIPGDMRVELEMVSNIQLLTTGIFSAAGLGAVRTCSTRFSTRPMLSWHSFHSIQEMSRERQSFDQQNRTIFQRGRVFVDNMEKLPTNILVNACDSCWSGVIFWKVQWTPFASFWFDSKNLNQHFKNGSGDSSEMENQTKLYSDLSDRKENQRRLVQWGLNGSFWVFLDDVQLSDFCFHWFFCLHGQNHFAAANFTRISVISSNKQIMPERGLWTKQCFTLHIQYEMCNTKTLSAMENCVRRKAILFQMRNSSGQK